MWRKANDRRKKAGTWERQGGDNQTEPQLKGEGKKEFNGTRKD